MGQPAQRRWVAAALAAEAILVAIDILTDDAFLVRSLYVLPVLASALRADPRGVGLVGGVASAAAVSSVAWNGSAGDGYLVPVVVVVGGSVLAVWAARERDMADTERRQMRLLADAAQITDGAADIHAALERLTAQLVPELGDAAWIDVVVGEGRLRRLAVRAIGADAAEIEAWLMERPRTAPGPLSASGRVLEGEGPQIVELDEARLMAILSGPEDRRLLEQSDLRMAMAVPLAVHGRTLGVLSLGVGRSGRRFGPQDARFAELLAGRAALALDNEQLVGRLRSAQERLDGILGALAEAVTVNDETGRTVYANDAAVALLGVPDVDAVLAAGPGELAGRFEITDADGNPVADEELPGSRAVLGERPAPLLTRSVVRATGEVRWFLTKATPLRDAATGGTLAVNVIEDVTQETEASLRERYLTEAGKALASSLDYEETLQRVAQLAVPRMADWCAVELPDERGQLQQVALAHVDPAQVELARVLRERYPSDPESPVGSHAVLRTGRSQIIPEVTEEMLVASAQDEEHLELLRGLGLSSGIVVPMVSGGTTRGVMSYVFTGARRYDEDDLPVAEELASRAAIAVENARLYTERSQVAHTLQASLLPEQLPELPHWRTAADYRAGQVGAEVGGDFYDLYPVESGAMVILGDVTGKGVTAAALTSLVRHTARTGAYYDTRPTAILELVNRALRRQPRIAPVTMLCALLRDGEITLAAGGHPLPLLKRENEPVQKLGETGLLLGAVDDYDGVRDVTVALAPGDTVLLFTDGVTDTPGADGRFGDAGLRDAVEAGPSDPAALVERIATTLSSFQRGTVIDDRAMVALQYTGASAGAGYDAEAARSSNSTVPLMTALADTRLSK